MKGLVHIYCGEGKGKTTAAEGALIRACGNGMRVVFVQFLKDYESGELKIISELENVKVILPDKFYGFYFKMTEEEKREAGITYERLFFHAIKEAEEIEADMLILDEIIQASNYGFVKIKDIVSYIKNKPYKLEIILTGRNPDSSLLELGDYVSEIKKIKHPYDTGIQARKGIEK